MVRKSDSTVALEENSHLFEALQSEEFLRVRTAEVALNPKQRTPFTLIEHRVLSHDRLGYSRSSLAC